MQNVNIPLSILEQYESDRKKRYEGIRELAVFRKKRVEEIQSVKDILNDNKTGMIEHFFGNTEEALSSLLKLESELPEQLKITARKIIQIEKLAKSISTKSSPHFSECLMRIKNQLFCDLKPSDRWILLDYLSQVNASELTSTNSAESKNVNQPHTKSLPNTITKATIKTFESLKSLISSLFEHYKNFCQPKLPDHLAESTIDQQNPDISAMDEQVKKLGDSIFKGFELTFNKYQNTEEYYVNIISKKQENSNKFTAYFLRAIYNSLSLEDNNASSPKKLITLESGSAHVNFDNIENAKKFIDTLELNINHLEELDEKFSLYKQTEADPQNKLFGKALVTLNQYEADRKKRYSGPCGLSFLGTHQFRTERTKEIQKLRQTINRAENCNSADLATQGIDGIAKTLVTKRTEDEKKHEDTVITTKIPDEEKLLSYEEKIFSEYPQVCKAQFIIKKLLEEEKILTDSPNYIQTLKTMVDDIMSQLKPEELIVFYQYLSHIKAYIKPRAEQWNSISDPYENNNVMFGSTVTGSYRDEIYNSNLISKMSQLVYSKLFNTVPQTTTDEKLKTAEQLNKIFANQINALNECGILIKFEHTGGTKFPYKISYNLTDLTSSNSHFEAETRELGRQVLHTVIDSTLNLKEKGESKRPYKKHFKNESEVKQFINAFCVQVINVEKINQNDELKQALGLSTTQTTQPTPTIK